MEQGEPEAMKQGEHEWYRTRGDRRSGLQEHLGSVRFYKHVAPLEPRTLRGASRKHAYYLLPKGEEKVRCGARTLLLRRILTRNNSRTDLRLTPLKGAG
jgi:hypothetical protein